MDALISSPAPVKPIMPRLLPLRRLSAAGRIGILVALLILAYAIPGVAFYGLNYHSLFPGVGTHGRPHAIVPPSKDYELLHFTTSHGDLVYAIFGRALDADNHVLPDAASRPTVLYFYCNAVSMADSFNEFGEFRRLGFNVMIPDYPGYGMSSGWATEESFSSCAQAAFDQLCQRPDVDPTQIASVGWSLGAAVATDLATHRPVMCLATLSAFTSWSDQTGHLRWIPRLWPLCARFDNLAKFRTLRCPVFIAHGRHDETVWFQMCMRLAAARGGVVPLALNCGHNVFEHTSAQVMSALAQFIEGCRLPQRSAPAPRP